MKGLIRYLSPFAPDQSGAAGVFYGLGGMTVICDAGGCTGNICGFDEPRWFTGKSAMFSAGLRDMDAILGRDDQLVAKMKDAAGRLHAPFAVLIGTPVPAVIGTDFRALRRMAEKRCGIPVLAVSCTGTRLYDAGEEDAYLELMRAFAGGEEGAPLPVVPGRVGVLGATPMNTGTAFPAEELREKLVGGGIGGTGDRGSAQTGGGKSVRPEAESCGPGEIGELLCYGADGGLDAVRMASSAEKNLVIAPSGLKAALWMRDTFGTPFEACYPLLGEELMGRLSGLAGKRVLVIHQQIAACEVRRRLRALGCTDVTAASFFRLAEPWREDGDVALTGEDQLTDLILNGGFDAVIADRFLLRAARSYGGQWIDFTHFAVSGSLNEKTG